MSITEPGLQRLRTSWDDHLALPAVESRVGRQGRRHETATGGRARRDAGPTGEPGVGEHVVPLDLTTLLPAR